MCVIILRKKKNETTSCAEKISIFVLSSHLDAIGEQNNVQYLSISCQYLVYLYCTYLRCAILAAAAAAAAAVVRPGAVRRGSRKGGDELGWAHTQILDKAPTKAYKRKPQQTRQK